MSILNFNSKKKPVNNDVRKHMTFEDHVKQTKKENGWDNITFSGKPITKRGKKYLT